MKELTIIDILKLNKKGDDKIIYFLISNEEIVYIGKSNGRVLNRISQHIKTKEFDNVKYISVETKSILDKKEKEFISQYRPKLNIQCNNPTIKITETVKRIIESNTKTKHKVNKLLNINKDFSSKDIAELISKSIRTIERYRKKCR